MRRRDREMVLMSEQASPRPVICPDGKTPIFTTVTAHLVLAPPGCAQKAASPIAPKR
jgi:hypothetical protein